MQCPFLENTVHLPLALDSARLLTVCSGNAARFKTKVQLQTGFNSAFKAPERRWIEAQSINKGQETDEETSLQADAHWSMHAAAAVT
jgi:hypothetical protein